MNKSLLTKLLVASVLTSMVSVATAKESNKHVGYTKTSKASWYGGILHGRKTASGSKYNQWGMTAAHKTLPFGSKVRVTNLHNNKSVVVTITDRGPYIKGRDLDLSKGSFSKLAPVTKGVIKVKYEVIK